MVAISFGAYLEILNDENYKKESNQKNETYFVSSTTLKNKVEKSGNYQKNFFNFFLH